MRLSRGRIGIWWLVWAMLFWFYTWNAYTGMQQTEKAEEEKSGKAGDAKQQEGGEKGKNGKGNSTPQPAVSTVTVKVTKGGSALERARVFVSNEREYEEEKITNSSGQASFSRVPRGRVQIQVKPPDGDRSGKYVDVTSEKQTVTFDLPRP